MQLSRSTRKLLLMTKVYRKLGTKILIQIQLHDEEVIR